MQWFSSKFVPNNCCFSLICDSDSCGNKKHYFYVRKSLSDMGDMCSSISLISSWGAQDIVKIHLMQCWHAHWPLISAGLIFKSLQLFSVCSMQWYTDERISFGSCSTHLQQRYSSLDWVYNFMKRFFRVTILCKSLNKDVWDNVENYSPLSWINTVHLDLVKSKEFCSLTGKKLKTEKKSNNRLKVWAQHSNAYSCQFK